jgi:hypothetical protein
VKAALVTGAGSGIGRAIAHGLARHGAHVFGVALGAGELEQLTREIEAAGGRVETLALDLTAPGAATHVHAEAARRGLVIDTLVSSAGMGLFGEHLSMDVAAVTRMITLNAVALTELFTLFARDMRARGEGRIMNVASTASFQPLPGLAAYAATKHYVAAFTLALADELEGTGVKVSLLCPGTTRTPFIEASGIKAGTRASALAQRVAMTPEEVASRALRALDTGERFVVAGALNRAHHALSRTVPPRALSRVFGRVARATGDS